MRPAITTVTLTAATAARRIGVRERRTHNSYTVLDACRVS
jgi:hypothetical protein